MAKALPNRFPNLGDVVTRDEMETLCNTLTTVDVNGESVFLPVWRIVYGTLQGKAGDLLSVVATADDDDTLFTADIHLAQVGRDAWCVMDFTSGFESLAERQDAEVIVGEMDRVFADFEMEIKASTWLVVNEFLDVGFLLCWVKRT